jgi:hypothetical protein
MENKDYEGQYHIELRDKYQDDTVVVKQNILLTSTDNPNNPGDYYVYNPQIKSGHVGYLSTTEKAVLMGGNIEFHVENVGDLPTSVIIFEDYTVKAESKAIWPHYGYGMELYGNITPLDQYIMQELDYSIA